MFFIVLPLWDGAVCWLFFALERFVRLVDCSYSTCSNDELSGEFHVQLAPVVHLFIWRALSIPVRLHVGCGESFAFHAFLFAWQFRWLVAIRPVVCNNCTPSSCVLWCRAVIFSNIGHNATRYWTRRPKWCAHPWVSWMRRSAYERPDTAHLLVNLVKIQQHPCTR